MQDRIEIQPDNNNLKVCTQDPVIKVKGFSLYGPSAASHRVRLSQYVEKLKAFGIILEVDSLLDERYLKHAFSSRFVSLFVALKLIFVRIFRMRRSDDSQLAIVYCELLPLMPAFLELSLLRTPFIYDFDDAFHLKYSRGRLGFLNFYLGRKIDRIISQAECVTAGNAHLLNYAGKLNAKALYLPSVVDTDRYFPSPVRRAKKRIFTVGWLGSPSTAAYLSLVVEPLKSFANFRPVRFVVIGGKAPRISGVEVVEESWSLEHEVEAIQGFDVGIMPLFDDEWAEGKCAYKLIQYMACGIPVVASHVGANIDVVTSECGFLARTTQDWERSLEILYDRPEIRLEMGEAGRDRVQRHFSLEANVQKLANAIRASARELGVATPLRRAPDAGLP